MNDRADYEDVEPPGPGWQLVLLHASVREARTLAEEIEERLAAFDADALNAGGGVALGCDELEIVGEQVRALQDAADLAAVIAEGVRGRRESLVLSAEDVTSQAERAMRDGSAHRASVLLSAALLDVRVGLPALADAVTSEPGLVSHWGSLTVGSLLETYRDSDTSLTQRVCAASGVHPNTEWASLDVDEVMRVADALRRASDA